MALRRKSDKLLQKLKQDEQRLMREIGKSQVFTDGIKTRFWKEIEIILVSRLAMIGASIESELNKLPETNDRKLIKYRAQKEILDMVLDLKSYTKIQDTLKQRLAELQSTIKDHERFR